MVLKLYIDLMSQPSRALRIFFSKAKIPFEECPVALRKGAHKQPDFLKINRFGRVPVIDDNGFKLTESVAILRYVTRQYPVADHWYPKETKARARVDEFLEWQHSDLRLPCSMFFRTKVLTPMLTGKDASQHTLDKFVALMTTALDNVENLWLNDGKPYLTGDKISIADILAACEIEQTRMAGYDPTNGRPNLSKWLQRLRSELQPHYDEAHVYVNKLAEATGRSKL